MSELVIYTMNHCPYCERAKALLRQRGITYREIHVSEDDDAQWEMLHQRSGMRTMPQIFLGEKLLGGYTDLAALDSQDQLTSLRAPESVFVIGAGSIGAYFAARLSKVAAVTLICSEGRTDLWKNGITLGGTEKGHYPIQALSWSQVLTFPSNAYILITTKVFHFPQVLSQVGEHLGSRNHLVLFQNGLRIREEAEKFLSGQTWARAVCWLGARLENPGLVQVAGTSSIDLAGGDAGAQTRLAEIFTQAGLSTAWSADVSLAEWRKALWNVSLNGLCALAGVPNRMALEDPLLKPIFDLLLDEAMTVAQADGVNLTAMDRERVYEATRAMGANLNSTLQDLRAGRMTEMPWLNGSLICLAEKYGVSVPAHRVIHPLVRFREQNSV